MKTQSAVCRFIGLAMVVVLSACIVLAQTPAPAPPSGPAGGSPGRSPTPTPTPSPTPTPFPQPGQRPTPGEPQQQRMPEMQRPVFLSGKVMLDDGTPPPDSVVIERVCNGINRPEGYTDSKGRFSFELGRNNLMMADASVSSAADASMGGAGMGRGTMDRGGAFGGVGGRGISERDLMGCELRAVLPGFRSDVVNLAGRRVMDNPDVGTIVLHRLGKIEGFTWSATTALAPKDAKKAYEKGLDAKKKNKLPDAQREFEKAVQIYPKYAVAWFELGMLHEHQKNFAEARKAFGESLQADSKYTKPYMQMAMLDARENKWQDVADTTSRALRLNPFDPVAYFYNAAANLNLRKLDDAEKSARESVKLDSERRIPKARYVLGLVLAQKEDYSGAAEQLRDYIKVAPAGETELPKKQLAELEKALAAKTNAPQPAQQQ